MRIRRKFNTNLNDSIFICPVSLRRSYLRLENNGETPLWRFNRNYEDFYLDINNIK